MKLLLLPFLSMIAGPFTDSTTTKKNAVLPGGHITVETSKRDPAVINFQDQPADGKMSSVVFKNQEYCRAELPNFEFDVHFTVVSATVYFTGANFHGVEKGAITGSSLKPIKTLMQRSIPGSIVTFDDVKVKGPDDKVRTIPGVSLVLY